jgi:predicted N-formylglutamate amidohydrolase
VSTSGTRPSLLGPEDPLSYRRINPGGAAPCLIICDHASRAIPHTLANLGLEEEALRQHIAWDIGTADVSERLAERLDAPLVASGYSRLVIDANRYPGDPTSIPAISDGVVIPGNRDVTPEEAALRAEQFFWPYHNAIEAELGRLRSREMVPAIISIHSFTPSFQGFQRPWHIGILSHHDRRMATPLLQRLRARPDLSVGDNQPYSARNPAGYSMAAHAEAAGYPHALIEIRQDLIDTAGQAVHWADLIAGLLGEILADPTLYRMEPFEDERDQK